MKIKDVEIKNNLFLAPLAGVSDIGFRAVCRKWGAGITYTEMISAKGLKHNSKNTAKMLETTGIENPVAVQIFGSNPEIMAEACTNPLLQKFDIIDINMGCPVPKVVGNGEGAALMKNLALAEKIIASCVNATQKPITVKFRIGWDENSINAVEFAKMCEKAGASAITVHGRTIKQMYGGKADYQIIKQVVNAVKIPVIANGDVFDRNSYQAILQTGAAGVMIARGALGNPWIFKQVAGKTVKKNKLKAILEHISILNKSMGERFTVKNMRKHIAWYLKGENNSAEFKQKIFAATTIIDVENLLKNYFKSK